MANAHEAGGPTTIYLGGTHIQGNVKYQAQDSNSPYFQDLVDHVASGALYDTAEITEPAKCHPGTREAILRRLEARVKREDDGSTLARSFTWMHGSAGAGKSAIMRSLCEALHSKGALLASFFFFRTSPSLGNPTRFVPTFAFQFCRTIPALRPFVQEAIQFNPLIFSQTLETQTDSLLVQPFLKLQQNGLVPQPCPSAIVVDGLDECEGPPQRKQIILLLNELVQKLPIQLSVFTASRPHYDIRRVYESAQLKPNTTQESLNTDGDVDNDIRKFYQDKFSQVLSEHPLSQYLPVVDGVWPTSDAIEFLVDKASGQFIFAATVIRFVEPDRSNPDQRLKIILGSLPPGKLQPFRELDALYKTIFSVIEEDNIQDVLLILGIILCSFNPEKHWRPLSLPFTYAFVVSRGLATPRFVEDLLGLEQGHCRQLFFDLGALMTIAADDKPVQFFHKSIRDFLLDEQRAGDFFISQEKVHERLLRAFITLDFWHADSRICAFQVLNFKTLFGSAPPTAELEQLVHGMNAEDIINRVQTRRSPPSRVPRAWCLIMFDRFLHNLLYSALPNKTHLVKSHLPSLKAAASPRFTIYRQHPDLWALLYISACPSEQAMASYVCASLIRSLSSELIALERNQGFHLLVNGNERGTSALTAVMLHSCCSYLTDIALEIVPERRRDPPELWSRILLDNMIKQILERKDDVPSLASGDLLHLALQRAELSASLVQRLKDFEKAYAERLSENNRLAIEAYLERASAEKHLMLIPEEDGLPQEQPTRVASPVPLPATVDDDVVPRVDSLRSAYKSSTRGSSIPSVFHSPLFQSRSTTMSTSCTEDHDEPPHPTPQPASLKKKSFGRSFRKIFKG